MSKILGPSGMPVGRVGQSVVPIKSKENIDAHNLNSLIEFFIQNEKSEAGVAALAQLVHIPLSKLEPAITFWKPIYFDVLIEGRHLNGIEAYELGDPEKTPGTKCNKGPYIAMCNLMALEGIRMMGDSMPTSTEARLLAFATEKEKEIANFWKWNFAPTEFQVEWAWKNGIAAMAGEPLSTKELLEDYRSQLD